MGQIDAICTSEQKGERKKPVSSALFVTGWGIRGDAHAGHWHRQISLLAVEHIERMRIAGLHQIAPGDFAENLIISGIDVESLGLGTRIQLGDEVELRISQIGKACHKPCQIHYLTGNCIMPSHGLFARVERGGAVSVGQASNVLRYVNRSSIQVVVLTLSDRCSCGRATDTAGPAIAQRITETMDAHVYATEVLPDDVPQIVNRLQHYSNGHSIDLILTVGGTGFSSRDVAPEATRSVVNRLTPGLDEAMRMASFSKTPHAMLSRACSGIRNSTLIVNLPGSKQAALDNLEAIASALPHGLAKLRGDTTDCGRPEETEPVRV